ncbi:flagellar basal-body MS-ring/collar protein FliF [Caloranaerobacter azorensis]|uniref:Flagellar M-ring protein n=1 Tax=Caloranaerobacter azorensis TaxID=116090 RepID=A0A6P1YA91_9FIRM|nr:flagellar basal-body MS-ring/collar protein FliF [Caloranaerobacter azorensis]QIB26199.1 flagellar M-ring protein FliF [Caloranaerobacter azorensis]
MSETINKIRKQLNDFWSELDKTKKIKLTVSAFLIIISVSLITYYLTRTEYEVLYKNLSLKDAGLITDKLNEMGIKWKNADEGTTILVPKGYKNKVKIQLATEGLPKDGYSFLDALNDNSWTMTDYEKRQRLEYALENELASTITEIDGIEGAKVYLDIPDENSFVLKQSEEATASVFIKLSRGHHLSKDKVLAIRNLVAGAVKEIKLENVSIIDDTGNLLTADENIEKYNYNEQLDIQWNIQRRIDNSIKRFLETMFGYGNVDVRSSVKMNFDSEVTKVVQFQPPVDGSDEGLIRSMEQLEENMINGPDGGVPGVDSNSDNIVNYVQSDKNNSKFYRASKTINYELNEINKQIEKAPGSIESITVAILINEDAIADGELSAEEKKEIVKLIYAATGLDTKQVQVNTAKFNKSLPNSIDYVTNNADSKNNNLILILSIAFVALAGIFGTIYYYRRKNEKYDINDVLEQKSTQFEQIQDIDLISNEKSEIKSQIEKFIDKKPEAVAQLLRTWLNED